MGNKIYIDKNIFQRVRTRTDGSEYVVPTLYIRYYDPSIHAKREECVNSVDIKVARQKLREREGSKDRGEPIILRATRTTLNELFDLLENDYKIQGYRSADILHMKLEAILRKKIGIRRASSMTFADIEAYKADRKAEGVANSTINRELAYVKRAYKLGVKAKLVNAVPGIEMLEENNAREGFVTPEQFKILRAALPDYLAEAAEFGYASGWRKNEILGLKWSAIDRLNCVVTLGAKDSKNKKSRRLNYRNCADLRELIERQWNRKRELESSLGITIIHVFFHANGSPIKDFRGAWKTACDAAGLSGKLFHDLRRSAVRNMVRAGISEKTAMTISGHRSRAIFDRYDIISDQDREDASSKLGLTANLGSPFGGRTENDKESLPIQ